MATPKSYEAAINGLKNLKENGRVFITFEGNNGDCSFSGDPNAAPFIDKKHLTVNITIQRTETLESIAEKITKADTLMNELEEIVAYNQSNPDLYECLKANLT